MTVSYPKASRSRRRRVREQRPEPLWLTRALLEAIHDEQLREHGGSSGVRDEGLLESAMNRPRNKHAYGEDELGMLAAAYAFGIARNHAFVDGNKRTAFVAAALFRAMNGRDLQAPEPEVVDVMTRLAAGKITEAAFAAWIDRHMTRA